MNILLVCENLDQQGNVKNMQMYFSTNLGSDSSGRIL